MRVPSATVDALLQRYEALSAELAECSDVNRSIEIARSMRDAEKSVQLAKELFSLEAEMEGVSAMLADPSLDDEMREIATSERDELLPRVEEAHHKLALSLLPQDAADSRGAILEVRAGTGGEEAALFAGDLFRMYARFVILQGWKMEILSESEADMGGYKEIIAEISGEGVYRLLKYESGVHRVQRVPETEASGRIHTSAATVAVLPEAAEVDFSLAESDLRIDVYRASGAGGQHVNKTESAVRITHIPTGVVVAVQDDRSQHRNKAKAMSLLRSKLYDAERLRVENERASERKSQVGSGDRSERIRTYNFPQGRLTDHRINLTLYSLEKIVAGDGLMDVVEALIRADEEEKLQSFS
jgi:peptide chain release factor 1